MAWITAPLNAGPIPGTTYNYTIPGLSANTTYEYRAYMIVGGVEYFGQTRQINTLPLTQVPPTVITGVANIIDSYNVTINNNNLVSGGTKPIIERGIVWSVSPNPTMPTDEDSSKCDGATTLGLYGPLAMSSVLYTTLNPSTTYYVRAYACSCDINGSLIAHGAVCTIQTPPIPITPMDVCLFRTFTMDTNSGVGCICTNPLLTASEYLTMNMNMEQTVVGSSGTGAIAEIFCKTNACPYFVLKASLTTNFSEGCKTTNPSITLNTGDCICWQQSVASDPGSSSRIQIVNISAYSSDINPSIDLAYYCDCVYT